MRYPSYLVPILLGMSCGLLAQPAPKDFKTYTILYTGRLMGYARTPDTQRLSDIPPFPDNRDKQDNRIAAKYLKLFQTFGSHDEAVFRLGMGDNFAPDLASRTFELQENVTVPHNQVLPKEVREPKDRFDFFAGAWHWVEPANRKDPAYLTAKQQMGLGHASIPYDNVAQFLIRAGYQVLVPGKHDFYYGPDRLRSLAALLEQNGVRMLGSNLIISTTRAPQFDNVYPRTPERLQDHPYNTGFTVAAPDLPDVILPYKQEFVVKNGLMVLRKGTKNTVPQTEFKKLTAAQVDYAPQFADVQICREANTPTDGNPGGVQPPGGPEAVCMQLVPAIHACPAPLPHQASTCSVLAASAKVSQDAVYLFKYATDQLVPGLNHLFCAKANGAKWTCQPFQVEMPMFWYGSAVPPLPYALLHSTQMDLAVFGVVDPDLLSNVGLLNYGWLNDKDRWDTVAKVVSADYAIKQALEACNRDAACRGAHKVVMAQMSYAKAAQLITKFKEVFDAVISQADAQHNTGNRVITAGPDESGNEPESPFLLTPPEPFDNAPEIPTFTPKLSRARITSGVSRTLYHGIAAGTAQLITQHTDCATLGPPDLRIIDDTQAPLGCPAPPAAGQVPLISLSSAAESALRKLDVPPALQSPGAPPPPPAVASDPVRDITLLAMKERLHTDIALLQKRDLFDADRLSGEQIRYVEVQNQLQQLIWKGDFLVKLHVTGATLKKVLKQSKKFDDLDQDALATEVEKGRALLSLGIWKDPKDPDSFYVNGAKLDDALLYSVAASEYLGLGDTGYADLVTPDVPPNYRIEDFNRLYPIAGISCNYLKRLAVNNLECDEAVLPAEYFDTSSQKPFDQTPGFNALRRYLTVGKRLKPVPVGEGSSGTERYAQQRHFWSLNLEYIDFSFTGTYINHINRVAQPLSGISAPGVTTTGSHSLGADHKIRGTYDFGKGTFYLLNDSAYMQSSTTSSPVPTITNNVLGGEAGGTFRLFPRPRPSWLMAQYSIRYERQLTDSAPTTVTFKTPATPPSDPLAPPPPPLGTPNLYINPPSLNAIYGRAGMRAEFGDTYIEMGLEQVDSRNVLARYKFGTPSGTIYCFPTASTPLSCGPDANALAIDKFSITSEGPLGVPPITQRVDTANYLTGGAYFNFNLKFPIWSKRDATGGDHSIFFQATNKFDLYFNSPADTSVQTRYLGKLTTSLNFPIFGKLMLTPKADYIMYENKLGHTVYRSIAPSIGISYSFKLRQGMDLSRSLGYGAITQTPQTAGSAH
jgi:hypothetical protein